MVLKKVNLNDFIIGLEIETTNEPENSCSNCAPCDVCEPCYSCDVSYDEIFKRIKRVCNRCDARNKRVEECYYNVKEKIEDDDIFKLFVTLNDEKKEIIIDRFTLINLLGYVDFYGIHPDYIIDKFDITKYLRRKYIHQAPTILERMIYRNSTKKIIIEAKKFYYICILCLIFNDGRLCCGYDPICCREHELCSYCHDCSNGSFTPPPCEDCDSSCSSCSNCSSMHCLTYDKDFIEKFIDRAYHDGSCGTEFVTKPFKLKEFVSLLKEFYEKCEIKDLLKPPAGGHINISFNGKVSSSKLSRIVTNYYKYIIEYIDLVGGIMRPDTYDRRGDMYRQFMPDSSYREKYSLIRIRRSKFKGLEIRWTDIYHDFNQELTAILFNVAILKKSIEEALNGIESELNEIKLDSARIKYKKYCRGNKPKKEDFFKSLEKFKNEFKNEISEIKEELGYDLIKLLKDLYRKNTSNS